MADPPSKYQLISKLLYEIEVEQVRVGKLGGGGGGEERGGRGREENGKERKGIGRKIGMEKRLTGEVFYWKGRLDFFFFTQFLHLSSFTPSYLLFFFFSFSSLSPPLDRRTRHTAKRP